MKPKTHALVTARSSAGLRDVLFDELDLIRNGKSTSGRANSVAKLASGILETVRVEIDADRYSRKLLPGKKGALSATGAPVLALSAK